MAGNHLRGEVELVVGETTYTLRLSANALAEAEGLLSMPVGQIVERLHWFSVARGALWGALREHHKAVTVEQAGEMFMLAGVAQIGAKLGESLRLSFPEMAAEERPQEAVTKDGTGAPS